MIVFLVMSVCASVNCYFNSVGDGLDSWKNLNLLQVRLGVILEIKCWKLGKNYSQ